MSPLPLPEHGIVYNLSGQECDVCERTATRWFRTEDVGPPVLVYLCDTCSDDLFPEYPDPALNAVFDDGLDGFYGRREPRRWWQAWK